MNLLPILLGLLLTCLPVQADDLNLDSTQHPVTRRTLRAGFTPTGDGPVKIAFFDADSTLRVSKSGSVSASSARDVLLLPLVAERLASLSQDGYLIAIVSNQGGIPKFVSLADAEAALRYTIHLINQQGTPVDYFDLAETKNVFRKPGTGMADLAEVIVKMTLLRSVDWAGSIMVGDSAWRKDHDKAPDGTPGADFSNSDRLFAEDLAKKHVGFKFLDPADFFGWRELGLVRFHTAADVEQFYLKHPELRPPTR